MAKKLIIDANSKPLTKTEILKLISNNANISTPIIKEIFDDLQNLMFAELDRCGEFKFLDMGKIKVKYYPSREGKNPLTGEIKIFESRTKLRFTFSKKCKEFANSLYI